MIRSKRDFYAALLLCWVLTLALALGDAWWPLELAVVIAGGVVAGPLLVKLVVDFGAAMTAGWEAGAEAFEHEWMDDET